MDDKEYDSGAETEASDDESPKLIDKKTKRVFPCYKVQNLVSFSNDFLLKNLYL
jgi:hypothetical protein